MEIGRRENYVVSRAFQNTRANGPRLSEAIAEPYIALSTRVPNTLIQNSPNTDSDHILHGNLRTLRIPRCIEGVRSKL
ncbi:hypothetical protein CEXT_314951 [Caerostris extrusa]|uniref:Uncharacterized protein n=1 Tax=Caerostris extrusa TaxID=172846 RepID=A0AAV4THG7_CAEEX|nr:hypothetical protein CEXT_314951 [Caerostris extrusa]